jgi:anti-anti-sigma factor
LDISQRIISDVLVISIKIELASTVNINEFSSILKNCVGEGIKNVVVDLGDIKHFNSTHIGMLVSGYITLIKGHGDLKLANLSERVNKALHATRLDLVFDIYPTVEEAIDSCK